MFGSIAFRETLESGIPCIIYRLVGMVSALDHCKRALVILIRTLSGLYGCSVTVTRDSSDASVRTACRKLSKKVHPDRGGSSADQSSLNNAYEAWCDAGRGKATPGRPAKGESVAASSVVEAPCAREFRFQVEAPGLVTVNSLD